MAMYVRNGSLVRTPSFNSNDDIFELEDGAIGIVIIDKKYRLHGAPTVECVKFKDNNEESMFYTSNGHPIPLYAVFQYIRLQQAFQDLINKYGSFK